MNPPFTCPPFQPPRLHHHNIGPNYVQEGGKETSIKIDSKDRNINVYPDPFSFRVVFNPIAHSTPKPYCDRVLNNVKSIRLEYLTLPMTTSYTLKSSGLITMGWREFNSIFSTIDSTVIQLVRNAEGNFIIIAAEKTSSGTIIRKNQILFKTVEVNDRYTINYTNSLGEVHNVEIDIEQVQYDDNYFIVTQQVIDDTNAPYVLNSIVKSTINEQLEIYDDYHDRIVTIVNNQKHIGSILSVHDTIQIRNKYYYVKEIVTSSRVLLNSSVDRTWNNVSLTIAGNAANQTITIDKSATDLFDSSGTLKLKPTYIITIDTVSSTIISVSGNTIAVSNAALVPLFGSTTTTVVMWKNYEELKTFAPNNDESLVNQRYISFRIKELNPSIMATNNVINNSFAVLHTERYSNGNIMIYPNADITFDQQNLHTLHTMTFEFFDEDFEKLSCNFSEYFLNESEYKNEEKLLIHPLNKTFQIFMSFKVVTIEQTLVKNTFC